MPSPGANRRPTSRLYIRRARLNTIGRVVKISDNLHNSQESRLEQLSADEADFLRKRYRKALRLLTWEEK